MDCSSSDYIVSIQLQVLLLRDVTRMLSHGHHAKQASDVCDMTRFGMLRPLTLVAQLKLQQKGARVWLLRLERAVAPSHVLADLKSGPCWAWPGKL